jgi:hypothetical protein
MKIMLLVPALIVFAIGPSSASISSNQEKMDQAYADYYANATVNCEYKYFIDVPKIDTVFQENQIGKSVSARYKIGNKKLAIIVTPGGSNGRVELSVDNTVFKASLVQSKYGKVNNHIKINLSSLDQEQQKISKALNLSEIDCSLDIGQNDHFKVTETNLHINMHPHQNYDLDGESIPGILEEFKKPGQHLVLFDDQIGNKNNYLSMNYNSYSKGETPYLVDPGFQVPAFEIPKNIPMNVSQAGHNKFILTRAYHEITFSGGNHNFCILNNTRRVLHGFMDNPKSESLTIKYPMSAIVVQSGSWLKGAKVGSYMKYSNMLSNVFGKMKSRRNGKALKKYLSAYFNYFSFSYMNEKIHYFKTITINQTGIPGFEMSKTIQGKGEGHLEVNFVYE